MRTALVLACALTSCAPGPVSQAQGRGGPVRLDAGRFADAQGPWFALGTTMFWALWGEKHDPERLEKNLAFAAREGIEYIRILSMVGSESWADRVIDPRWPDYWQVVDRLAARTTRLGLRIQVTVFADAQVMMPDAGDRERWVDAWAARVSKTPDRFLFVEVANEYWQNGLASPRDVAALGVRFKAAAPVLVAPSAPQCLSCLDEWRALMADGALDLATPHFGRDRDAPVGRIPAGVARGFVNNEPIGPQSSVESDEDPERLASAARETWRNGGAGYTLHTGAGIRGGGRFDRARGRSANLFDVPAITRILAAIRAARAEVSR